MTDQIERLLNKNEAAKFLGIAVRTLDHWMQQRKIPFHKIGTARKSIVRFKLADLEELLRANRIPAIHM
ncbi:MAG: helix-turn-helix domain-containing protein [Verrucomicrobiales bacterium]|jgi:excisionase family DNA binding protein|nr:helix-turn-helix domain-containing protein [Verrucomicrobiales bacterium]